MSTQKKEVINKLEPTSEFLDKRDWTYLHKCGLALRERIPDDKQFYISLRLHQSELPENYYKIKCFIS